MIDHFWWSLISTGFFFSLNLSGALANDTFASIDGGNVHFEKTTDISMDSEELNISQDEVSVDYQFRNLSKTTIESDISFPLAELFSESPSEIKIEDWLVGKDPLAFQLKENGTPKPVKIITQKDFIDKANDIFKLRVNYIWKQKFPVGDKVHISHSYRTILGTGGSTMFSEAEKKQYCMDKAFLQAFEALKFRLKTKLPRKEADRLDPHMHYHSFGHFSYILKTANNWAGPIGVFRLKLRKRSPTTLISTCWDGLRKTTKTEFISEKKEFRPTSDLDILFVDEN